MSKKVIQIRNHSYSLYRAKLFLTQFSFFSALYEGEHVHKCLAQTEIRVLIELEILLLKFLTTDKYLTSPKLLFNVS